MYLSIYKMKETTVGKNAKNLTFFRGSKIKCNKRPNVLRISYAFVRNTIRINLKLINSYYGSKVWNVIRKQIVVKINLNKITLVVKMKLLKNVNEKDVGMQILKKKVHPIK